MAKTQALSREEVWNLLKDRARKACEDRTPVFTLQKGVRNYVSDVSDGSIGRVSDDGRSNSSRVGRAMIYKVWDELAKNGTTKCPEGVLYFTMALMQKLLPELVEHISPGELGLLNSERAAKEKSRRLDQPSRYGKRGRGGEGPIHRAIKDFIYADPDVALSELGPKPFTSVGKEYPLGHDLVDVALMDGHGCVVLVEVKPMVEEGDRWPFAQAAKYRTLWHILDDTPLARIRAVVAAPSVPEKLASKMRRKHGVEAVVVQAGSC